MGAELERIESKIAYLEQASAELSDELYRQSQLIEALLEGVLLQLILVRSATQDTIWAWSLWRRKHQATARHYHYQRRSEPC